MDWSQPAGDAEVASLAPWTEVRGRLMSWHDRPFDLVIALDLSESTFYPSGRDLDGDGIVGVLRPGRLPGAFGGPAQWTTDADDTVIHAAVEFADRLLALADPARVRAGLLTFAGRPRSRAFLGDVGTAARALAGLRVSLDPTGTDLARAIRRGLSMFDGPELEPSPGRERILLLLSDGVPTAPGRPGVARHYALRAGDQARAQGVRIFSIELGPQGTGESVLEALSKRTRGASFRTEQPDRLARYFGGVDPAPIARVSVRNLTTGEPGRAVRWFADGSFDGFVGLAPGPNRLEVYAERTDGRGDRQVRVVYYRPGRATPRRVAKTRALLGEMRSRTVELTLARDMRRPDRARTLEVEVPVPRRGQRPGAEVPAAPATSGSDSGSSAPATTAPR